MTKIMKRKWKKLSQKIWHKTLLYKTYDMFASIVEYFKDKSNIEDVFYGDDFKNVLKTYLNLDIYKDWIGRLYGVINPNIDINGHFNMSNTIIEIDGDNTNNNDYIKTWIYKQLNIMGRVFDMKHLYMLVDMEIRHVGPVEYDNYLIIFDIVSRKLMVQAIKRFFKQIFNYGIPIAIILGILSYLVII